MSLQKYSCDNCGDVFFEQHGHVISNGKNSYIVCPNCSSESLEKVSTETPISLFYAIGDICSIGVKVETENSTDDEFEEKVWCLYGDSFGEINSYYLTLREAINMAYQSIDDNEFEPHDLIIAKGK